MDGPELSLTTFQFGLALQASLLVGAVWRAQAR